MGCSNQPRKNKNILVRYETDNGLEKLKAQLFFKENMTDSITRTKGT